MKILGNDAGEVINQEGRCAEPRDGMMRRMSTVGSRSVGRRELDQAVSVGRGLERGKSCTSGNRLVYIY